MYLELSGRRSGKTTRLIDAVFDHIFKGGIAIVFGFNIEARRLLKEHFNHPRFVDKVLFFYSKKDFDRFLLGNKHMSNFRVFYDEFDLYKGEIIVSNTGYYCGTMTKLREPKDFRNKDDILIKLLDANNGNYISKINMSLTSEYNELGLGKKIFSKEILGKFIK